jgi:hypothetical protein
MQCAAINWDGLQIENMWEEEGRQDVPHERAIYRTLGLQQEDEMEERSRREAEEGGGGRRQPLEPINDAATAIPCTDDVPGETRVFYDLNNPVMEPGALYRSMEQFRLALRQYAINKEFELGCESSNRSRYRAFC